MLHLENSRLKMVCDPEDGARIHSFIDKKYQEEWVWRMGDRAPEPPHYGSSFDAHWRGGWQDIFPSDMKQSWEGKEFVDHGDLWSQSWEVVDHDEVSATLRSQCRSIPVTVRKRLQLQDEETLHLTYQFHNDSQKTLPYMFRFHPAITIFEGDEIRLPDCTIEPVDLNFSTLLGSQTKSHWPYGQAKDGHIIALNKALPASSKQREFVYASDFHDGWCGIRRAMGTASLHFFYDRFYFPYVWVLESFGGFNEHQVVLLEPSTTVPYNLLTAIERGTTPYLQPGETREYHIRAVVS